MMLLSYTRPARVVVDLLVGGSNRGAIVGVPAVGAGRQVSIVVANVVSSGMVPPVKGSRRVRIPSSGRGVGGQVDQQLAQQLLAGPGAEDLPGRVVGVEQPAQPDPLLGGQGAAVADQSCRQAHASLVVEHDPSAEGPEERPSVDASAFGRPSAVSGK